MAFAKVMEEISGMVKAVKAGTDELGSFVSLLIPHLALQRLF